MAAPFPCSRGRVCVCVGLFEPKTGVKLVHLTPATMRVLMSIHEYIQLQVSMCSAEGGCSGLGQVAARHVGAHVLISCILVSGYLCG